MAALASDWLTHFEFPLKNGWWDLLHTCHACSLWCLDQVLLLFKSIRNPIWPPWPLIGWHNLNYFSIRAEEIYSKLATSVPYKVLTKCCYFPILPKSSMAAFASDLLTHFEILLKNGWKDLLHTCHKCSVWGPDQLLLLLKPIWNPIWPPCPLIFWHIFNVRRRMAEEIYHVLQSCLWCLTKCF